MPEQFRLIGLEPDNLLAFLALLGTMRALKTVGMNSRVCWQGEPVRPLLILPQPLTEEDLLEAIHSGVASLAVVHEFPSPDIAFSQQEARTILQGAMQSLDSAQIWSAIISDGACKESDGSAIATPLCAMFGSGHQHFLQRLGNVPRGLLPNNLKKMASAPDLNDVSYLKSALLEPWVSTDATESFRWDPTEDRRYALRFENPSTDKGLTVHGANRLAAVGFPLLTCAPTLDRNQLRLTPRGGSWESRRFILRWPIWPQAASLAAVLALLQHPELRNGEIPVLGISTVVATERISVGKFFNFTRATRVLPIKRGAHKVI